MIDDIKQAVENLTKLRAQVNGERVEIMGVLHNARFVKNAHRDLIDRNYRETMDGYNRDIHDMEENLKRLEANNRAENQLN